jgi:hypothetical protein
MHRRKTAKAQFKNVTNYQNFGNILKSQSFLFQNLLFGEKVINFLEICRLF